MYDASSFGPPDHPTWLDGPRGLFATPVKCPKCNWYIGWRWRRPLSWVLGRRLHDDEVPRLAGLGCRCQPWPPGAIGIACSGYGGHSPAGPFPYDFEDELFFPPGGPEPAMVHEYSIHWR